MSTSTPSRVPAGWYHDPAGSGHPRWWDGAAWTDHLLEQDSPPGPDLVARTPRTATVVSSTAAKTAGIFDKDVAGASTTTPSRTTVAATTPGTTTAPITTVGPAKPRVSATTTTGDSALSPLTPAALEAVMARIEEANGTAQALGAPRSRQEVVNTLPAWTLAAMPALFSTAMVALFIALDLHMPFVRIGVAVLFAIWVILLAIRDAHELRRAGHEHTASPAWILLSPLAYLIARASHVRARTASGYGPVAVWAGLVAVQLVAIIAFPVVAQLLI